MIEDDAVRTIAEQLSGDDVRVLDRVWKQGADVSFWDTASMMPLQVHRLIEVQEQSIRISRLGERVILYLLKR